MGGRTKRSKRQSDGSPERSRRDPFVLFLDETLHNCQPIHSALSVAGVEFVRHGSRFSPGTLDVDWLPVVGKERWALLTSDKSIRYNQLEKEKIVQYKSREFVLASGNLSGAMMGEALTKPLPKMKRLFAGYGDIFIAYLSQAGSVEVRFDEGGSVHERKSRPKRGRRK
jgi:hypothetical protein